MGRVDDNLAIDRQIGIRPYADLVQRLGISRRRGRRSSPGPRRAGPHDAQLPKPATQSSANRRKGSWHPLSSAPDVIWSDMILTGSTPPAEWRSLADAGGGRSRRPRSPDFMWRSNRFAGPAAEWARIGESIWTRISRIAWPRPAGAIARVARRLPAEARPRPRGGPARPTATRRPIAPRASSTTASWGRPHKARGCPSPDVDERLAPGRQRPARPFHLSHGPRRLDAGEPAAGRDGRRSVAA